jgi:hypothetical protein
MTYRKSEPTHQPAPIIKERLIGITSHKCKGIDMLMSCPPFFVFQGADG